jgi:hypothetical protein
MTTTLEYLKHFYAGQIFRFCNTMCNAEAAIHVDHIKKPDQILIQQIFNQITKIGSINGG